MERQRINIPEKRYATSCATGSVAQDLTRITPCCLIREKRRHHWGRLLCRIPIYTDWTRRTEE